MSSFGVRAAWEARDRRASLSCAAICLTSAPARAPS